MICARNDCEEDFEKKTHNQKYCSDVCCSLATNARLMVNYYLEKDRKNGVERLCSVCKETKLSRYNPKSVCSSCSQSAEAKKNNDLLSMLKNSSLLYLDA